MKTVLITAKSGFLLFVLILAGCAQEDRLGQIEKDGVLRVAIRNSPANFHAAQSGLEYQLAYLFAEELGVELELHQRRSFSELLQYLDQNQVDLISAPLVLGTTGKQEFLSSRPYHEVKSQLVLAPGAEQPQHYADLKKGRLVAAAGGVQSHTLALLKDSEPNLSWDEIDVNAPTELLDLLTAGKAEYAIVDSDVFTAWRYLHPGVEPAFSVERAEQLVWYFPRGTASKRLLTRANDFLLYLQESGQLTVLKEQQFAHFSGLEPAHLHTFLSNMEHELPNYEADIREVAREYQMDWRLLAAIAYQESHWDPLAQSRTGVRGMMMLTSDTAREMGISNRLDLLQNLRGGSRYLNKIKLLLPNDIVEPHRTWFALAAYNVGRGSLEDARVITERNGGDPHLWEEVAAFLPLLEEEQYYKHTRHGYARGNEPVTYVRNIRNYYRILSWRDIGHSRPRLPTKLALKTPE
ncbi:MAG: membrane-bound lytic murein transglycosylase MltF [Halieaceae bacterium]|nr:membrane-bound lytic murein transglycosylase MltF [Halieaceae bacterium]